MSMKFIRLLKLTLTVWLVSSGWLYASRENLRVLAGAARQAERGDTATALEVCERLLSLPGREETKPAALYLKGTLEAGRGRLDTAAAAFRRLITRYPESDRVGRTLAELGLIHNRLASDSEAVRLLEPVAAHFPDSVFTGSALIGLARSAERCGLTGKALQAYLQYLETAGDDTYLAPALLRSAELLYQAGRVDEAYYNLQRFEETSGKTQEELELPTRMLSIGCLTGLGRPDSALRQAEELRRSSGDHLLESPRLLFLTGHAHLALGHLEAADSIFTGLSSTPGLESAGIAEDSVYRLLMEVNLSRGEYEDYFSYAGAALRSLSDPLPALQVVEGLAGICREQGRLEPITDALEIFDERFGGGQAWQQAQLIRARVLADRGEKARALDVLDELSPAAGDSLFKARRQVTRCFIYLDAGDTLRAEAELKDYLSGSDPLAVSDSLLWLYTRIKRSQGNLAREAELLDSLKARYPASRFWEPADRRAEELRLFDLSNPERAARELLDLFRFQKGQVSAGRLAQVAAQSLGDYERAAAILQESGVESDAERLKLIEYRYLAGLKMSRGSSLQAAERLAQTWRELLYLIGQKRDFPGREEAIGLFLKMYSSRASSLTSADVRQARELFLSELPDLHPGQVRSGILFQLAEEYLEAAREDTGLTAMFLADSARAMLDQVIDEGGETDLVGRAILKLAGSLEQALFAGAQDSAAYLYDRLIEHFPQTRWSALAGLKLGVIYLHGEKYSQAYRVLGDWISRNLYAADDPQVAAALAEASFLTGRYARAEKLLRKAIEQSAFDLQKQRLYRFYRLRCLTALERFAEAENRLLDFLERYDDPRARAAAGAAAVDLYSAIGNYKLAGHYLAGVPEGSDAYPMARIIWLRQRLARGESPDRVRRELEDFRRSPWNSFFGADPALEAHRGIMACYMAEDKEKDVTQARDDFRKRYPERRAGLAELMLDEVEYLVATGNKAKAAPLYEDLQLLFRDVNPRDRNLWVGAELKRLFSDFAAAGRLLEELAGSYAYSPYAERARLRLAYLYLGAGELQKSAKMLAGLNEAEFSAFEIAGLRAAISGAGGDWAAALEGYRRQWLLCRVGRPCEEALLGWAEAVMKTSRKQEAFGILNGLWSPEVEVCARARYMLAEGYREAGQTGEALELMGVVAQVFAGKSEFALRALYQQGLILESRGDIDSAVATYRTIEKLAGERSDWTRTARNRLRAIAPAP
ncbi:MAG: tetratricopeptide repeat protein [Candidatus Glassbacteria bacterium]|nr:tetratricopeptide repeat protein [Candidatus Glassbacteria bacterium]